MKNQVHSASLERKISTSFIPISVKLCDNERGSCGAQCPRVSGEKARKNKQHESALRKYSYFCSDGTSLLYSSSLTNPFEQQNVLYRGFDLVRYSRTISPAFPPRRQENSILCPSAFRCTLYARVCTPPRHGRREPRAGKAVLFVARFYGTKETAVFEDFSVRGNLEFEISNVRRYFLRQWFSSVEVLARVLISRKLPLTRTTLLPRYKLRTILPLPRPPR